MSNTLVGRVGSTDGTVVEVCQCIPGAMLATGDLAGARDLLLYLAHAAGTGLLSAKAGKKGRADVPANLWFIEAAYLYRTSSGDVGTWREKLLPLGKRFAHRLIAGEIAGATMNDSGLMVPTGGKRSPRLDAVAVNMLWDNALTILAEQLREAGDPTGDHCERLVGRFRRGFLKAFWCDPHGQLCAPGVREAADHATAPAASAAEQLMFGMLPFSAVPRTRQRQMLDDAIEHKRTAMGICVGHRPAREEDWASPLFLAWLVEGHVRTSETPATAIAQGKTYLEPAYRTLTETGQLARYYVGDEPVKGKTSPAAHGPTMAEVRRVWQGLEAAASRSPGNSKRSRICGIFLPERV